MIQIKFSQKKTGNMLKPVRTTISNKFAGNINLQVIMQKRLDKRANRLMSRFRSGLSKKIFLIMISANRISSDFEAIGE